MFELPPCCRLMMTRWPSGENRGEKLMPAKLPTISRWPVSMLSRNDARIALAERHVGDFLRRRREPRRQHQVVAARQIAHVGAVLVHDGEPLDAAVLRTGLVDEHHAAVEIALLAGQPLVDRVGDDVGDAAPVVGGGEVLLAGELLGLEHVPQPEFGLEPAVGLARDAAGHQRLRVDGAPVGKARHARRCWRCARCRRPDRSARTGRSA